MGSFITLIAEYVKKIKKPNTITEVVALWAVLFSWIVIFLKCIIFIFNSGFNKYYSIPPRWNTIYYLNILSQIILFLGVSIVIVATNYIAYLCMNKFFYLNLFLISIVTAIIPIFILTGNNDKNLKNFIAYYLCIFCLFFMFGIIIGLSNKAGSKLKIINYRIAKKIYSCDFKISNVLILLLIMLFIAEVYHSGGTLAKSKRQFYVIENDHYVVLSENDSCFLCMPYEEKGNNTVCIYTNKQKIVNKESVVTMIKKYKDVTIVN